MSSDLKQTTVTRRGLITSDNAARVSLILAAVAVVALGLGTWLAVSQGNTELGLWTLIAGTAIWVVAWWGSIGFAVVALRNAPDTSRPKQSRRRALLALAVDAAVTLPMVAVVWSVLFG